MAFNSCHFRAKSAITGDALAPAAAVDDADVIASRCCGDSSPDDVIMSVLSPSEMSSYSCEPIEPDRLRARMRRSSGVLVFGPPDVIVDVDDVTGVECVTLAYDDVMAASAGVTRGLCSASPCR